MPTRKPARPFRSLALSLCFHMDLTDSFAERGGLSRFAQGPTALQEQTGVAVSRAYSKALKTFRVLSPPSMRLLYSPDYLCRARGLSRVVRGPTTSKERGGSCTYLGFTWGLGLGHELGITIAINT